MITGVPAAGKTSVVGHPTVPHDRIQSVEFGMRMLSAGRELGLVRQVADLESLPLDDRLILQRRAVERLRIDAEPLAIDGHLLVDTGYAFVPGLPADCVVGLSLDAIVVLTSKPGDVIQRRSLAHEKYHHLQASGERIDLHQRLIADAALHYALSSGAAIEFLSNPQGAIDDTARRLVLLLEKLVPEMQ